LIEKREIEDFTWTCFCIWIPRINFFLYIVN
jgi:hypothetical protein